MITIYDFPMTKIELFKV